MKQITGNLIDLAKSGVFDVIIHGCNCFHTMGGGIALQVKQNFPSAYLADTRTKKGDREKLGTISCSEISLKPVVSIDKEHVKIINNKKLIVVNAYTQWNFKKSKDSNYIHVSYEAVRKCMKLVKLNFSDKKIGYPMIGAGLAGGDWNIISNIINEELEGTDHTLVIYEG